ncbi:MFS transporter [Nocardia sp. CA2R105]|uniref:MFS transporter n=1 Tax=Nocardia coffeae TaxID=2873381 RepID=UPI001CA657DC|nr:MFS transporter [Nocardia coffeae]MBY8858658.1 MFS transporter [Nocardia coffeae]
MIGTQGPTGSYKAVEKLLADGRVRAIGVCNHNPGHLRTFVDRTDVVPSVNQIELHPYFTQFPVWDANAALGVVTQSWSPLGGVNMYRESGRKATKSPLSHVTITEIAAWHRKTPAKVILPGHLQHGLAPIPKSVRAHRIAENFDVFDSSSRQTRPPRSTLATPAFAAAPPPTRCGSATTADATHPPTPPEGRRLHMSDPPDKFTNMSFVVGLLALGTFLMGTIEFVIASILPEMASVLGVSVSQAGLLITAFAIGMIVGSPAMAIATLGLPRRPTPVLALVVFAVGHVIAALSSSVTVAFTPRALTALATGAVWSVSSVVAAAAPPSARSCALGAMLNGASLATVVGVPVGSRAGQAIG